MIKKFTATVMAALIMLNSAYGAGINVKLDNENVEFESQQPVIVDGRTLIPLRGVFEKLGYEITWDAQSKTAVFVKEGTEVRVTVNADSFSVNGEENVLDVPAQIINGSMMLPLRAVGEATGLEVNWDGDSKTVSLFTSKAESTTETVTEEITEIIPYDYNGEKTAEEIGNSQPDTELLQRGAGFYVTMYSVLALYDSFEGSRVYYNDRIQKALTYSYSEKELAVIFDEAVEECGRYKNVVSEMLTKNTGTEVINKYDDYVDACINDFKAMKIYYCTDSYDDLSAEEAKAKLNISLENVNSAFENLKNAMSEAEERAGQIAGNGRIGIAENSSEEEKAAKEEYYKETGAVVNEATAFMTDIYSAAENPLEFEVAADKIRKELNSADTPESCMLEKEIMLICCDLLDQAGENIYKGAFKYSGNNEYYIKFEYSVAVFDMLFNVILDKEYSTKYVADDENSAEDEFGLESQTI